MSIRTGIKCTYLYHDNDVIELHITAGNKKFSGSADVYVGRGQLLEAAATLQGFPNNSKDAREVVFGAFGSKYAGGAVQLQFYCKDLAGHSVFRATIEGDYRDQEGTQSATAIVDFEPASLDSFLAELRLIDEKLSGSAELKTAGS
ncbi:hypothetical protein RBB75_09375 [Tunturibacter empetritectus]|uniref:Uncharacterized protein n=1 Tax=Tunturiibacter empetritectus TaxID=3069691 RepID=A0AAU7ZI78_9BACT